MDSVKNIFGSIGRFLLYLFEFLIIIYVIVITTFLLFRNKYGYTEVGNTTFVPLQIDTAAASILRATLVNIISIYPIVHYIHLHINLDKF